MRALAKVVLIGLFLVPQWMGEPRAVRIGDRPRVEVKRIPLDAREPAQMRAGRLTYLGGWHFTSSDRAFGGYSSLSIQGERFTLLGDGGLTFAFDMGRDLIPRRFRFGALPDGPGTGWAKSDRDSESIAVDPVSGRAWVGFERSNAIWRYAPGLTRAERWVKPAAMRDWPENGGAEAVVRLANGRFLVFSENEKVGGGARRALLFDRDPTDSGARVATFAYRPPAGYLPTDAAQLDSRRLLVLTRAARLPEGFTAKLTLVDLTAIRAGAHVKGEVIATFAAPLVHDNFEGVAVTREGGATIVWLVSDDNGPSWFQRTLLLKFRLDDPVPAQSKRRAG